MRRFYQVKAKCGHVGRNYYYEGTFYQMAASGRDAAEIVRYAGRVKHDRKDAILSVEEISFDEYVDVKEKMADEVYFRCRNKQEQDSYWQMIVSNVREEQSEGETDSEAYQKNRKDKIKYKTTKLREKVVSMVCYEEID